MTLETKASTPLMQQYLRLKERYPEEVLFFRLGDFYEMFFEDAVRAAPLLEVTLTQRQSVPMCGVPHHAATGYLSKLLKAGLSVAMAEQLEDPKKTKGMVKRDVVRVITPGTIIEDELLPARANNFLTAVAVLGKGKHSPVAHWAICAADVSTGRQWVGEVGEDYQWNTLRAHLAALSPTEILLVGDAARVLTGLFESSAVVRFEPTPPGAVSLTAQTVQAVKNYLTRDHVGAVPNLQEPVALPAESSVLFLDETALRHLELVTSSDASRPGPTLLSVIDQTVTPLGSRLLRWWLLHPSRDRIIIEERLNQVQAFVEDVPQREELQGLLKHVADLERICVRAQNNIATPRDLEALRGSLGKVGELQTVILRPQAEGSPLKTGDSSSQTALLRMTADFAVPPALVDLLSTHLADEPSAKVSDGGVIREGLSAELDELRGFRRSGKKWIAEMEAQERERSGIQSLKVGYNDIFGYYLEVSKANLSKVPTDWIRKQTLANGERYITPALKEQEEKILGAEQKILALESSLYAELVHHVASFATSLQAIAQAVAHLDAVAGLAQCAVENQYVRPVIKECGDLVIKGGRHPVVERQIGRDRFIPNDLTFDDASRIALITGPNMAGKSTYLRQAALIVILAQMGSFVPAESAEVGLVDKIFTRIGASDRLAQGQSTFMVEMQEVATLLRNATPQSLLILDEVGRGTSTYDGVSIAWSVVEQLGRGRGDLTSSPRTLFATHYFELTQLAETLPGVFNAHATAKEWPGPDGRRQVVFLYQIRSGAADRSYGIHVAEMAGLPQECIDRARQILKELESSRHPRMSLSGIHGFPPEACGNDGQLDLFAEHPAVGALRKANPNEMTPLEALQLLSELKKRVE